MKMLLYCTKAKPYLVKRSIFVGVEPSYFTLKENVDDSLNGKIVAECDFEVENLKPCMSPIDKRPYAYMTRTLERWELAENSCLSFEQLDDYLKPNFSGYAIHIKNLKIFDKPKELSDYVKYNKNDEIVKITKAPQNMMYAYECIGIPMYYECHFCGYDEIWNDYILISIQPQWLCKILNGEKTIEVRKKVLKGMIK